VNGSSSSLSVLYPVAALRVIFFHLSKDALPPLGHIIGVVHSLVRQLQELDGFVVEVLKIQLLYGLFARSFGTHRSVALNRSVEMEPKHKIALGWNGRPLILMESVCDPW